MTVRTNGVVASDVGENVTRVGTSQVLLYDEFSGSSIDTSKWDVTNTGAVGVSVASSVATIGPFSSGGTQSYQLLSKATFKLPCRYMVDIGMSGATTNQDFLAELVSVDSSGAVDGKNIVGLQLLGSLGNTNFQFSTVADTQTATTVTGQVQSGWSSIPPGSLPWEIEIGLDHVYATQRDYSSNAGERSIGATITKNLPDPTATYKLRLLARNVAGVGTRSAYFGMAKLVDFAQVDVSATGRGGGRAGTGRSLAIPVDVQNSESGNPVFVGNSSAAAIYTRNAGGQSQAFTSTATLTGGSTYSSGLLTGVSSHLAFDIKVTVRATGASLGIGHLVFENTTDGSTFREEARYPVPNDGIDRVYSNPITAIFYRVRFINGSVAQSAFYISAATQTYETPKSSTPDMLYYQETATALAGGATYTGLSLDLGAIPKFVAQRAFVYADQAGTLSLQQSRDGTNWRTVKTQAVGVGETYTVENIMAARFCRVLYVNGGTIQGAFELLHTLVATGS